MCKKARFGLQWKTVDFDSQTRFIRIGLRARIIEEHEKTYFDFIVEMIT